VETRFAGGVDRPVTEHATLREAVANSTTAEFTTLRDDRPATVPLTPLYDPERDVVVVTAPIAFTEKAARAAETPEVGLLLHGRDGPVHVAGRATVRDGDLEANAERVERLIESQPPSQKRAALRESTEFLQSRLGRLLFDWYALRVVIEVEPVSIRAVNAPPTPGVVAWAAADVDGAEAATYDRAVATVVDGEGWPRTWPLDRAAFAGDGVRLAPPSDVSPDDGRPACVLCHGFSPDLRDVTHRLVRGRIRDRPDGTGFDSASSYRLRNESALDLVRFVVDGKRRARRNLRERGERYWGVPTPSLFRGGDDADRP
jgi:hypothetical protein